MISAETSGFHILCSFPSTTEVKLCLVLSIRNLFVILSFFSFFFQLSSRLLYLPAAVISGVLGFIVDFPLISLIALCKSPYMLFKGWHRLFHDLIGREGPFLETICVPFAGLVILLWPLAVAGAVLGSMVSSIFLGAYAGVVVYQVKPQ